MQSDTTSELHVCFKRSYDTVLRHHHTFVIRSVVSVRIPYLSIYLQARYIVALLRSPPSFSKLLRLCSSILFCSGESLRIRLILLFTPDRYLSPFLPSVPEKEKITKTSNDPYANEKLRDFSKQVAIRAVPRRNEFYKRIAQGGSIEKLDIELAKWLVGLDAIVKHLSAFLHQGGHGRV